MSRKPSNERVKLPGIDTKIWVICRFCLGDKWWSPSLTNRYKVPCQHCKETGKEQILAIYKRDSDIVTDPPPGFGE